MPLFAKGVVQIVISLVAASMHAQVPLLQINVPQLCCNDADQAADKTGDWGSITGISEKVSNKVYDIFNTVGTVAFAFSFADRLPKIQVSS